MRLAKKALLAGSAPRSALAALPRRVPFSVTSSMLDAMPSAVFQESGVVVEELSVDKNGLHAAYPPSHHLLRWHRRPENILVVKKTGDSVTDAAFTKIARWLSSPGQQYNVVTEAQVVEQHREDLPNLVPFDRGDPLEEHIDAVVALGGDGTLLHVSSLFQRNVPPVLSFSLGTLGFLMPFSIADFEETLTSTLSDYAPFVPRMRLHCTVEADTGGVRDEYHVLNEVTLHRGREPSLAFMDVSVDGEHLTNTLGDGIILATPTGSTAYSLSAGGSIVHPNVKGTLLTPICPRSLSFRPMLLSVDCEVRMRVSPSSRGGAEASFDGRRTIGLRGGDRVRVRTSRFPVPTICRHQSSTVDWVHDVTGLLKWNQKWGT